MVHVLLRNDPLGYYIVEANIKPFELLHIQLEAVSSIITMLICETTQRANICFCGNYYYLLLGSMPIR